MSDFTQLPVKEGFKGCFDYTNYNGGNTWINQYADGSGINFNMSNAVKNDGYILFPETLGLGYLIDDIGNNFTLYSIFKCDYSATAVSASAWAWLIAALGASSAYRIYLGEDKNSFGVINCSKANTISANFRDYYITAISVCNGQQNVYVNGELVYTGTTTINYSIDEIGVNLNASGYGGAVPTISNNTANVYVKYIGYATNNHSEVQIQENSNWLLEQYGLKLPEKDSRLAGTDAVAIAYAIARNQESAAALQEIKKAYRDGTLNGDDENTSEEYTEDGSQPIGIDQDPTNPNPDKKPTSPGITDMSENGGVFYTAETDGETPEQYYIKIYTDGETGSDIAGEGTGQVSYVYTYHLCYAIYYADGTLKTSGTFGGNGGISRNYWYYKVRVNGVYTAYYWISGVSINGNKYTVTISGLVVSTGKQTTEQITGTFTSLPDNVSITTTTNVNPF